MYDRPHDDAIAVAASLVEIWKRRGDETNRKRPFGRLRVEGHGYELGWGIHRIEAPLGDRFVACYLIVGTEAVLLVDTGVDRSVDGSIVPYVERLGLPRDRVRWIVATHCDVDHMGGNAAAKQAFPAATLVAHDLDVGLVEDVGRIVAERYGEFSAGHGIDIDDDMRAWCYDVATAAPVDLVVSGGETIHLGDGRRLELMATPGHSPGSLSVWDPLARAAFIGDAALGSCVRTAEGEPSFPPTYRHVAPYRATIAKLIARAPELLLAAHEPAMDTLAALRFLVESGAFTDRLEVAVLELLRDQSPEGATTRELVEVLAPKMGDWPVAAGIFLANGLVGHLEALADGGRLTATTSREGLVRWHWAESAMNEA